MVSPFNVFPPYWGSGNRIYNLAVQLSHLRDVSLICTAYPKPISKKHVDEAISAGGELSVEFFGIGLRGSQIFDPKLFLATTKQLKTGHFSATLGQFLWSSSVCIPACKTTDTPYFLDQQNIESTRLSSVYKIGFPLKELLRYYEALSCRLATRVFCVSEADQREIIRSFEVDEAKVELVPHGVDIQRFRRDSEAGTQVRMDLGISLSDPVVLFFGPASYKPNKEAVDVLISDIAPLVFSSNPRTRVLIVGRGWEHNASTERLIFLGHRHDIERYINASNVVAAPVYSGGGAQLKVVESLACGTPVITTPFVASHFEGTSIRNFLIVAKTAREFAKHLLAVFEEESSVDTRAIRREYSWQALARRIHNAVAAEGC